MHTGTEGLRDPSPRERKMPNRAPQAATAVLALCGMAASLQQTLVIPLLPDVPRLLGVSGTDASWLVTATLLTAAVATPIVSRMADMYGKRRMLAVSLLAMVLGSLMCALTTSFALIVAGRAMQGFAAALVPVGISILRDQLPGDRAGSAVALMSATLGIGSALGLPLSGVLSDHFGFHSVFWFGALASALLLVALYVLVPESELRTQGRFDVVGAVLLSVALTSLLLMMSKGGEWGWTSPRTLGLLLLSAVALVVWLPIQLRINQPMVDLRTFSRRPVLLTNVASFFIGIAMYVNFLITPQVLELPPADGLGFGLTVTAAGLAMVPAGMAMLVVSPLSGAMLNRWGGRPVMVAGALLMAVAYALRVPFSGTVEQVIIGSTVVGIGTALAFASMPTLIMSAVPITETASGNGINSLVRAIGTSMASAVVATILASFTVVAAGETRFSTEAVQLVLLLAALASLVATVVAVFIPRRTVRVSERLRVKEKETVVRGRVRLGTIDPTSKQAIVCALDLDGHQVDWTRADHDGSYSLVLPGPGTYVVLANAQGWAPRAEIFEFADSARPHELALVDELLLSGTVGHDGVPCPGAVVALSEASGEPVSATRCNDCGRYRFALPPAGRYLLTAIDGSARTAEARKVTIGIQSMTVDLDLDVRAPAGDRG